MHDRESFIPTFRWRTLNPPRRHNQNLGYKKSDNVYEYTKSTKTYGNHVGTVLDGETKKVCLIEFMF